MVQKMQASSRMKVARAMLGMMALSTATMAAFGLVLRVTRNVGRGWFYVPLILFVAFGVIWFILAGPNKQDDELGKTKEG